MADVADVAAALMKAGTRRRRVREKPARTLSTRLQHIHSSGGYLRVLTEKAGQNEPSSNAKAIG